MSRHLSSTFINAHDRAIAQTKRDNWCTKEMLRFKTSGKSKINFTPLEKEILEKPMTERKDTIENKRNDGRIIAKKEKAWEMLSQQFTARHRVMSRTLTQFKNL